MSGGVPVYVPLRRRPRSQDGDKIGVDASDAWSLNLDELRAAITPRTKVLVLNTPQNPTGKVFSRKELLDIAAVVKEHDLLVISDEVVRLAVRTAVEGCQPTVNLATDRGGRAGAIHSTTA